ncbi:MAG: ParB/RepB/Spo0J family partition protein [Candidatus Theseobacter exili]|nr:ParB/RepB/Spo0J family partition protein [Candidatus Theseobacter exili]
MEKIKRHNFIAKYQKVSLSEIDIQNKNYNIRIGEALPVLKSSIEKHGIIEPPLLLSNATNNSFIVLCGFRRIGILKEIRADNIQAGIIDNSSYSEFELFSFAVHDNMLGCGLNSSEKALVIKKLSNIHSVPDDRIMSYWMPLLSLPSNLRELHLQKQIADIEKPILESIANGTTNIKAAFLLSELDRNDRLCLFNIINNLKMGNNHQKQFLKLIAEISEREKKFPSQILNFSEVKDALENGNHNPPQRVVQLISVLQQMRNPAFSNTDKIFKNLSNKLNLPKGITLNHSPGYESEECNLMLSFSSIEELKQQNTEIIRIAKSAEIRKILEHDN